MKPPPLAAKASVAGVFPSSLDSLRFSDVASWSIFEEELLATAATSLSLARKESESHAMIESSRSSPGRGVDLGVSVLVRYDGGVVEDAARPSSRALWAAPREVDVMVE